MKTRNLLVFGSPAILIIGLAIGAYFFLKASDDSAVKEWRNDAGQLHRENDQPASISYHENGEIWFETWYLNDQLHRENDQPASIVYGENGEVEQEYWLLNDQLHRENDQPASIGYYENGEIRGEIWYIDGQLHRENDQPA